MRPQPGLEYATLPVWAAALLVTAACVVAGLVWGRLIYFASTGYCQDEVWKHHCVQPTYPVLWGLTYRDLRPGGQTTCTCHTVRFQRGDEYPNCGSRRVWEHIAKDLFTPQGKSFTKSLIIRDCMINSTDIEDMLTQLPSLSMLWIKRPLMMGTNETVTISKGINNMHDLQFLTIDSANVNQVSPEVNLPQLRFLELAHNRLRDVRWLKNMENINMVNLNDNRITSLPSNLLSSNPNLVDLAVERNQLTSLDNMEFGGPGELLSISLDGNQLKTIPPFLAQCSQLSILHLEGNQIDSLDVARQGGGGSGSGDGGDGDSGGAPVLAASKSVRALDVTRFARFALGGNPLCVAAHEGNTTARSLLGSDWNTTCTQACDVPGCSIDSIRTLHQTDGLGDGLCVLACNTTACGYDGGDCLF